MQCNQLTEITLPILSSTEENQIALPEIKRGVCVWGPQPKLQLQWYVVFTTGKQLRAVLIVQ